MNRRELSNKYQRRKYAENPVFRESEKARVKKYREEHSKNKFNKLGIDGEQP